MTALTRPGEAVQAGDVPIECPVCGEPIAVPVLCELVEASAGGLVLRCSPNVAPIREHAREHAKRLSRSRRP